MCSSRRIDLPLSCGLAALVAIGCGESSSPPTAITCGDKHACILRMDGSMRCWGTWVGRDIPPPSKDGPYAAVAAAFDATCGLDVDGAVTCWDYHGPAPRALQGRFIALSAGWSRACGLTSDGEARCIDLSEGTLPYIVPPSPEPLSLVRIGWGGPCGLRRSDSTAICWDGSPAASPPSAPLSALAVGVGHACGVRADGTLVCWGQPGGVPEVLAPPPGQFVDVKADEASDCAMRSDGSIACWGVWQQSGFAGPSDTFKDFCVGQEFGCGIRADNTIGCWGFNDVGQASPPAGANP